MSLANIARVFSPDRCAELTDAVGAAVERFEPGMILICGGPRPAVCAYCGTERRDAAERCESCGATETEPTP